MRKTAELLAGARRAGRLRLLSGWELLAAQAEAGRLKDADDPGYALALSACIVARSLGCGTGEALLRRSSAERIAALAERYYALCRAVSPSPGDEQALDALTRELAQSPYERLRWRVLRAFGVLPGEARARAMTDGELTYCAANLALDERERLDALCGSCREEAALPRCPVCGAVKGEENPAFDPALFARRKEADG